jgi:hypothetical protein
LHALRAALLLLAMDETNPEAREDLDRRRGRDRQRLTDLASVVTAVGAAVGGLYVSTQSVAVTAIGAALAAILVLTMSLTGHGGR